MNKKWEIANINDFMTIVNDIDNMWIDSYPWWRGQSVCTWNLQPSLYRNDYSMHQEYNMTLRFKNMAAVRHKNCPGFDNYTAWLFLMQHYKLPTRLLDWSESPLVALFFIVENKEYYNEDGVLWALRPDILNKKQSGDKAIYTPESETCSNLFKEAFIQRSKKRDKRIVALISDHIDFRFLVQKSTFTVHGTDVPLNKVKGVKESETFIKIKVSRKAKDNLMQDLIRLGITRSYLFPDLENLSYELSTTNYDSD